MELKCGGYRDVIPLDLSAGLWSADDTDCRLDVAPSHTTYSREQIDCKLDAVARRDAARYIILECTRISKQVCYLSGGCLVSLYYFNELSISIGQHGSILFIFYSTSKGISRYIAIISSGPLAENRCFPSILWQLTILAHATPLSTLIYMSLLRLVR